MSALMCSPLHYSGSYIGYYSDLNLANKPVFRPKMAIFRRAGMREEGVATPTRVSIFDSYDMKSLWFKFGQDIFADFKLPRRF